MTNEEYLRRYDAMRALPPDQQLPVAFELFVERAGEQSASISKRMIAEQKTIKAELERVIATLHEVAGAAQKVYIGVEELREAEQAAHQEREAIRDRLTAIEQRLDRAGL